MNDKLFNTDDLIFKGLLITIIFLTLIIFLVALSLQEKEYYSELFLKPKSYSNFEINNELYFTYGITNMEKSDQEYKVQFVAEEEILEFEKVLVKKGQTIEFEKKMFLKDMKRTFPFKFRIIATTPSGVENTFFWVKGKKIS